MQTKAPSDSFASAGTQGGDALTVYYDGSCPVCSREIAMYRRQTGADRCVWIDAAACPEGDLGADLTRGLALSKIHVRRADGGLVDGVRGFALMWLAMPKFAWAGRIASWGPFPVVLDAAYWIFLRIRPLWRGPSPTS